MSKVRKKLLITSLIFSQILIAKSPIAHADSIILNKANTDGVNVRVKEDVDSDILGGIEDFTPYEIKGESDKWYEIEFEGKKAYVGKERFFKINHTSIIEETNLKKEANSDSENLTPYKLGLQSKVTILEFVEDSDFVKVQYDEAFKDNKDINIVKAQDLENSDLLYSLSDSSNDKKVKTVTLDENKDEDIPEVVTLSNVPETVNISDDELLKPVEGYVKISSLAINKKDEADLAELKKYYDDLNAYIDEKTREEEALRNQVREITEVSYVTTTRSTYQNQSINQARSPITSTASQTVPVTGSSTGVELYSWATQFLGRPYVFGGVSLTNGIDCSGFTMQIYRQIGIELPHFAQSQSRYGIEIPYGYEKAGDLVFYGSSLNNITHVGMADGNGNMIHASSPRVGIIISPIRNPISIRRIIQ